MPAPVKIPLEAWQEHFDFLLPRKELLRADEVAKALGCDERTILNHYYEGSLHGHDITTHKQKRLRYRRDSVILFLAERANYAPIDLRLRITEVLAKQSLSDLALIQQTICELIRRKA